jgi:hypothetical protein
MGDEHSPDVRLALLEHRVKSLEDDRKWLFGAAVSALAWIAMQILPLIPIVLKGAGK